MAFLCGVCCRTQSTARSDDSAKLGRRAVRGWRTFFCVQIAIQMEVAVCVEPAFPSESLNAVLRHRSRTNVSRPRRRRRGRARYHKNEYTKRPHEVRVAHALSLRSVLAAGLLPARLIPGSRPWYVYLVSGAGGAPHDGTRQHDQVGWSGGGPHIVIGQYTFVISARRRAVASVRYREAPQYPCGAFM